MEAATNKFADGDDSEQTSPHANGAGGRSADEDLNVSIVDILVVLARNKAVVSRTILVFAVLGVIYAISAPEKFTSTATVARESQSEIPRLSGGLGALQEGLGLTFGGGGDGLTPSAYPSILQSREVRLAVVRDTFQFPDVEAPMTLVAYHNRPPGLLDEILRYTLYLPWTLKRQVGTWGEADASSSASSTSTLTLTEEEQEALEVVQSYVSTSVNQETGLMTVSATASHPQLAAEISLSFVHHLRARVREIRTQQVREQLAFVSDRFREAEQELIQAEDDLASFLERNQNPTTASLQFRRDRLQRQVRFKEQLYSNLQNQRIQAQIEVQRQQPVITIVEAPVPPEYRSSPNRTATVVLSVAMGLLVGCLIVFVRFNVSTANLEGEKKEKLQEIKELLLPSRFSVAGPGSKGTD